VWSRNQTGWRMMRTNIPEKLSNIVEEIDDRGGASLTRLTVLKKWFERTERLSAFAIWIATRAVSRQGKTSGAAAKLFREVRGMLAGLDKLRPQLDPQMAQTMHDRLRDFKTNTGIEGGERYASFTIGTSCWWSMDWTSTSGIWTLRRNGYKLAADYCQHYDSRYGNGLIGPSRTKIQELVRFLFTIEALEDVPR